MPDTKSLIKSEKLRAAVFPSPYIFRVREMQKHFGDKVLGESQRLWEGALFWSLVSSVFWMSLSHFGSIGAFLPSSPFCFVPLAALPIISSGPESSVCSMCASCSGEHDSFYHTVIKQGTEHETGHRESPLLWGSWFSVGTQEHWAMELPFLTKSWSV